MNPQLPTTDELSANSLATRLRNPHTLHRMLGVVLWGAFLLVLTWRGGA